MNLFCRPCTVIPDRWGIDVTPTPPCQWCGEAIDYSKPRRECPAHPERDADDAALANVGVEHWASMLDLDPLTNKIEADSGKVAGRLIDER